MLPYFCCRSNIMEMDIFLLQANTVSAANNANSALNYLPIGIQLLFAIGFVAAVLGLTHLIGPSRKTSDKLQNRWGMPASRWPSNTSWSQSCLSSLMWR